MSRLQVGGLALIIDSENKENIGKVVTLLSFIGECAWLTDAWDVSVHDGVNIFGDRVSSGAISAKNLMPLGDKQTQDELSKEKEFA